MERPDDSRSTAEPPAGTLSGTDIGNIRRRAFIQWLAKADAIAPAAMVLFRASANCAVGE